MFNKVILVGNLTRDPDLRYTQGGTANCTVGMAINRKYNKQDGSKGEEVCFIDIVFFGRSAEIVKQYLKKGSKVLVEGRLRLEQWTDQHGNRKSKHSIFAESMQMLDSKNSQNDNNYNTPQHPQRSAPKKPTTVPEVNIDDEIPF